MKRRKRGIVKYCYCYHSHIQFLIFRIIFFFSIQNLKSKQIFFNLYLKFNFPTPLSPDLNLNISLFHGDSNYLRIDILSNIQLLLHLPLSRSSTNLLFHLLTPPAVPLWTDRYGGPVAESMKNNFFFLPRRRREIPADRFVDEYKYVECILLFHFSLERKNHSDIWFLFWRIWIWYFCDFVCFSLKFCC